MKTKSIFFKSSFQNVYPYGWHHHLEYYWFYKFDFGSELLVWRPIFYRKISENEETNSNEMLIDSKDNAKVISDIFIVMKNDTNPMQKIMHIMQIWFKFNTRIHAHNAKVTWYFTCIDFVDTKVMLWWAHIIKTWHKTTFLMQRWHIKSQVPPLIASKFALEKVRLLTKYTTLRCYNLVL